VTEAEDAYRAGEPFNLQRHSDYLRERLVRIGARTAGDAGRPRYPEMFDRPLASMGYERAELEALTVGVTSGDGLPAGYRSFPDGSGLVSVTDSLVILANTYCEYLGRALAGVAGDGLLWMVARLLRTRWTGRIGEDPRLLAGILRYHNVCRRVWGVPAVLNFAGGPELADAGREVMLEFGLRFIVGHEVAHHVLGHRPRSPLRPPGVPAGTALLSEERETEADTLGLFAAAAAFEQDPVVASGRLNDRWRQEIGEFHGLLGAIITMLALQTLEQALLVRRGRTHRPAGDRVRILAGRILGPERQDALEDQLGGADVRMTMRFEKDRGNLGVYLRNLIDATALASEFAEGSPAFDWTAFARSPLIEGPAAGHLGEVAALDRLMCADRAALVNEIDTRLDPEGVRLVLAGDIARGLLRWGVPAYRVEAMHDPDRVLSFHTVLETVEDTVAEGDGTRRACVAAATLVARGLPAAG
jgi:hypothetical protein